MTAKERKARSLGVPLDDGEIRLLYYVWAACCGIEFCDPLQSSVYEDCGRILVATSWLLGAGYIEANPADESKFRLTKEGLELVYDLQS